ncbi:MAG TPA: hypothetical protein VFQ35_28420, partial [Polyangiaceae bacterium]|nr:hypothetical protein [Polyangiaceae bacterium]
MKTNPFSKQTLSRLARTTILVACLAPAACKGRSAGNTTATVNALVTREPRETKFDNGQVKETFSVTKDKSGNYVKDGSYARFHQSGQKAEEGTYKADKIDGHWQEWDEQGKLTLDLHFADGKREGAYAKYRNGSPRIVGNYSQDKLSGPFKFIDDGSVITGEMARGVPEGPWTLTDASGKL